jgi:hypothetical protein
MEFVSILRALGRHKFLVVLGFAASIVLGLVLAGRLALMPPRFVNHQTTSGVATTKVLVAAPKTPTTSLDPKADTTGSLGIRAELLADLLATDGLRRQIAQAAGIAPDQLAVLGRATEPPQLKVPLAVSGAEAAVTATEPYVVIARAEQQQVPIIALRASAPSGPQAARVIEAAAKTLEQQVANEKPGQIDLAIQRLGSPVVKSFVRGPRKSIAATGAALFFGLWCAAIVVLGRPRRRRRDPRLAPSLAR